MMKQPGLKEERFNKYLQVDEPDHDPLFLIATLLDPRYRLLLDSKQVERAKMELLKEVNSGNMLLC